MKKGGKGGSNTKTGSIHEKSNDLETYFSTFSNYSIEQNSKLAGKLIYHKNKMVARLFVQGQFNAYLLENNIDMKRVLSSAMRPDSALLVIVRDTLFIIEMKTQKVAGSVDEKLQTCDFKRKQYYKLVQPLGLRVEYVYVLNKEWFSHEKYKDVLCYINSVNCHYMFDCPPLKWLGLPE